MVPTSYSVTVFVDLKVETEKFKLFQMFFEPG
jgi:hypothetical protein